MNKKPKEGKIERIDPEKLYTDLMNRAYSPGNFEYEMHKTIIDKLNEIIDFLNYEKRGEKGGE